MKRTIILFLLLVSPFLTALGGKGGKGGGGGTTLISYTIQPDTRPTGSLAGTLILITDGANDSDCTVGGGAYGVICLWNGTGWEAAGDAGTGVGDEIRWGPADTAVVNADFVSSADITVTGTAASPAEISFNYAAGSIQAGDIASSTIVATNLSATNSSASGDTVHITNDDATPRFEYFDKTEHANLIGASLVDRSNVFNSQQCSGNATTQTCDGTGWTIPASGAARFDSIADEDATPLWSISTAGAVTAVTYGGILEANLVDKDAEETISGIWSFGTADGIQIAFGTLAELPAAPTEGMLFMVNNGDSGTDCNPTGTGTSDVLCMYASGAWAAVTSSGSGDLLRDGTLGMTGAWDIGSFLVTADNLVLSGDIDFATLGATAEDKVRAVVFQAEAADVLGNWAFTVDQRVNDGILMKFGFDSDWSVAYQETADDQLVFKTNLDNAVDVGDPMFQILVDTNTASGTNLVAGQDVFGVAKGTQGTNVDLFVVDAEGDAVVAGDLDIGASSFVFDIAANSVTMATVNDNLCDTAGEFWWDATDAQFEFCLDNSSAPATLGGGSATWTDSGTYYITSTDASNLLALGADAQLESAHLSITNATNNPGIVIREDAAQSDPTIIVETSADAHVYELGAGGNVLATSIGDVAGTQTWDIDTNGAATFASVTTGDSSAPIISFDDTEDVPGTPNAQIAVQSATNNASMSFKVDSGSGELLQEVLKIDSTGDATTVQIGDPGGTDFVQITQAGALTFEGNADIILPADSVDAGTYASGSIDADDINATLTFADGDLIDLSALNQTDGTEGLILPQVGSACTGATVDGQICWDNVGKVLYVGDGTDGPTAMATGGGDVTDVLGCAGADCSNITTAATTLLDFSGTDASTTSEGIILPQIASACAAATADGQICWDSAGDDLYVGDGSTAQQMNAAAPSSEVRSMYWGAGAMSADATLFCADPAEVTINSGPRLYTVICADNDASTLYGSTVMPDGWDAGTVTFELNYVQTAADTGALASDVSAQCRNAGTAINSTFGTEVAIDDAAVTGSNAIDATTSGDVTADGTCAAGDILFWKWQLDATGTNTGVTTLHILGMKMEYSSTIGD